MTARIPLVLLPGSPNRVDELPIGDTIDASTVDTSVVTLTGTQTLTNKTLTAPKVDNLFNGTSPDAVIALVGVNNAVNHLSVQNNIAGQAPRLISTGTDANVDLALQPKGTGVVKARYAGVTHELVTTDTAQTLSGPKTLTAPVIGDFTAANHTHASAAQGGLLTSAAFQAGSGVARTLAVINTNSTAIASTAAETVFDNFATLFTANGVFGAVGATVRVSFTGKFSTVGTPTIRFKLKGTTLGTVWDSGAITTGAGVTDLLFSCVILLSTRTIGASGVIVAITPQPVGVGAVSTPLINATTSFDFVANGATSDGFKLTAQWGTASASNTCTLQSVILEALN